MRPPEPAPAAGVSILHDDSTPSRRRPFTPRPRASQPPIPDLDIRTHLEGAAQTALDAADAIIAALDRLDATGEADASLTAMAAHAEQAVELREPVESAPEPTPVPQEAPPADPVPEEGAAAVLKPIILPWRGAGNVVSAAVCAVLALVGMRA